MRPNRPLRAVKAASVTALAAAACAAWALPAGAATAAPQVVKHTTKTVVSAPATGYAHTNIKLSASVTGGRRTPTGTVTFWVGKRKLCHGTLSGGKTSCDAKFADPATKTVLGVYSGDARHDASSGTTSIKIKPKPVTTPPPPPPPPPPPGPVATTTTVTNPPLDVWVRENAGVTETLTATVTAANGTTPTGGTVTFAPTNLTGTIPANVECTTTLVDGNAQCNVTPAVGTWGFLLFEATYSGAGNWDGSVSTGEHKLITNDITTTTLTFNPSPATEGDPVTLTATVTDEPGDALGDADGGPDLVTFSIGGVDIPGCVGVAVTDPTDGPDNVATCAYTPATSGTVTILAAYAGDDYASPSSDTETLTVNP